MTDTPEDGRIDFMALLRQPQQPAAPEADHVPLTDGDKAAYGKAALAAEVERVSAATEGTRNDTLNRAAFKLYQLVPGGYLSDSDVRMGLAVAARRTGLPNHEITAVLKSAKAGVSHPRHAKHSAAFDPRVSEVEADAITGEVIGETPEQVESDFWQRRPILQHIKAGAGARMVSAWALLGCTILRALAHIPPHVVLPPIVGSVGSLNAFVALVGPSGAGKGAAESAASELFRWPTDVFSAPLGSGEGITHMYAHYEAKGPEKGVVMDRNAVAFTVAEIDTLAAQSSRQGATLMGQVRSAYSGERLGFGYADATRRITLDRHTYRLVMSAGVQPERSEVLLADADGGTPQRFVWMPAVDRHIQWPPPAEPDPWPIASLNFNDAGHYMGGHVVIGVPDEVREVIGQARAARARGEGEALDGHSLFTREKVAAALMFLDGRTEMSVEDWELATAIMRVSDLTRAHCEQTLRDARKRSEDARTRAAIERANQLSESEDARAIQRVAQVMLRRLARADGECSWSELRRAVTPKGRPLAEDALDALVAADEVAVDESEKRRIVRLRSAS